MVMMKRIFLSALLMLAGIAMVPAQSVAPVESTSTATSVSTQASTELSAEQLAGEPETVVEPTIQLDEPKTENNGARNQMIFNFVSLTVSVLALLLSVLALISSRRGKKSQPADDEQSDDTTEQQEAPKASSHEPHYEAPVITTSSGRATEPKPQEPKPAPKPVRRTFYLSRPDANDCFANAAISFQPGNSLFTLFTDDGINGTFTVINNPDVHRLALMMPTQNLTRACSGDAIQTSEGKTRIVTHRPGRAVHEGGKWHITVKAVIHYE